MYLIHIMKRPCGWNIVNAGESDRRQGQEDIEGGGGPSNRALVGHCKDPLGSESLSLLERRTDPSKECLCKTWVSFLIYNVMWFRDK